MSNHHRTASASGEPHEHLFAINQVEYSVTAEGPVVHIFGRDAGGNAAHIEVSGFRPYFYAPAGEVAKITPPPAVEPDPATPYLSIRWQLNASASTSVMRTHMK